MQVYFGQFETGNWDGKKGWEAVQSEFETDTPEPEEVIFARYTAEGYEGDATIIYRNGDKYYYVSGSHCSCYGLEGQFEPEEYTAETLRAGLERGWMEEAERNLILDRINR